MPPKRKTKAATAGAAKPVSSSQPEPSRPSRTSGRTRRYSDGSNVSETPSSSQVATNTAGGKKGAARRGRPPKVAAEPEVIAEENEEVISQGDGTGTGQGDGTVTDQVEGAAPACTGPTELHERELQDQSDQDNIQVSQNSNKRVHFGSHAEVEDNGIDKSTATFITPHPRTRMTIKRRRSALSPVEEGSIKRIKHTRTSLPPSLSQEEPTQIIQELQFAPLRSILDARIRRLTELKAGTPEGDNDDVDMADDEMLVLDRQEEISVAQLPTPSPSLTRKRSTDLNLNLDGASNSHRFMASPGDHDREAWSAERKKFQAAILGLQREVDEGKAKLRILNIELESIGFAADGASSEAILESIRDSFAHVRQFLETELPGSLPEKATNEDLLEILRANVEEFAHRLRTADREMRDKGQLVHDLGGQVDGLLDRLAMREIDNATIRDQITQLDGSNTVKDRDLDELREDLRATKEERDDIEKERDEETARANGLEDEKDTLEQNIARLSDSLKKYQQEEAKLTDKINKMEEEHRTTVAAMNKEREETVRDLEDRLDKEMTQHSEAARLADDREEAIMELQLRIDSLESERNDLQDRLVARTEERDEGRAALQELEDQLDDKTNEVDDLEARVRRLEEELDEHQNELDNLRQLSANERAQREAAETDLDARNSTIEDLDSKLREQGKVANELRQKLFEVQTKNAEKVKELEIAASERDQQFQNDMAVEVARREAGEELAKERAAQLQDLEQQLEQTEEQMRNLLDEKDRELEEFEDWVEQKDAEIQNLRDELQTTEDSYETQAEQYRARIRELDDDVDDFQQSISQRQDMILTLDQRFAATVQDHNLQIEDRDSRIAILNDQVAELNVQKQDLENERARLERKVEHEAENMLHLQNETAAEIETLKQTIWDKQRKIQAVEEKVREADERWVDVLAARDEEIRALTVTSKEQNTTLETLKNRFGDYVRRSSGFIARLQEQVDAAKVHVDDEGRALQMEGGKLLGEFEQVEVVNGAAKKGKGKKKRREYDSGVGMSVGGFGESPRNVGADMLSS